jgi:hypothetical protein
VADSMVNDILLIPKLLCHLLKMKMISSSFSNEVFKVGTKFVDATEKSVSLHPQKSSRYLSRCI